MTYEPLHHKYRPQTFGELVGQAAIAATLIQAIQQQRIAPAYLFTGARGTGKTSSARILAKSLNCLKSPTPTKKPCGICEVCQAIARGSALDVIEIDAASNTGVDNIRELIERAQFAPVQCRYKVYIIDEVHMLSTAAFNALLKTLEEPPDRVVFVLATTDPQRVLPTIISRCQRFDYRRIPLEDMVDHLQFIAKQEGIPVTPEAITLVAQMAQGGLRDAESLLDQLSLLPGEISVEQVWDLVGSVPERDLLDLLRAIAEDHPELLLDSTRRLMDRGREPLIVLQNLGSFYRDLLIAKTAPTRNDLVALTPPTWQQLCDLAQTFDLFTILLGQQHLRAAEVQLKHTTQPRLWLEVTLMGLLPSALGDAASHRAAVSSPIDSATKRPAGPVTLPTNGAKQPSVEPAPQTRQPPVKPPTPAASAAAPDPPAAIAPPSSTPSVSEDKSSWGTMPNPTNLDGIWQDVIREMIPYSTQVMVRQQCQLRKFDGQQAQIAVSSQPLFKMAQGKLPNIEAAFETVFGRKIHVTLEVSGTVTPPDVMPQSDSQLVDPQPLTPNPPPPNPTDSSNPPSPKHPAIEPPKPAPDTPIHAAASTQIEPLPPAAPPPETHATSPEPTWEIEHEVTRAAKNLADFFAGQVVSLDDDPQDEDPTAIAPDSTEPQALADGSAASDPWNAPDALPTNLEGDEDDEDIPF
ncbi:MAG: DNA polymerase III subunit gamma/tau [Leptolyngbyaceae cyanobacterium bins.349]|nr:DNA polymerase III subunit gamma/tau [Leptolyngbyaceae cyanobacterium bins.349]